MTPKRPLESAFRRNARDDEIGLNLVGDTRDFRCGIACHDSRMNFARPLQMEGDRLQQPAARIPDQSSLIFGDPVAIQGSGRLSLGKARHNVHQRDAVTRIGRQGKTPIDRALGCFTEVDSDSNVAERQTDVVGAAARRDNQDGLCGLDGNALGDRSGPQAIEAGPLVRAQYDQVGIQSTRMQEDHSNWIAVLDAHVEPDAGTFSAAPQLCGQRETCASPPLERLGCRHGVDDRELGAIPPAERERLVKGGTGRFGEIDGGENPRKRGHDVGLLPLSRGKNPPTSRARAYFGKCVF